jgi:GNAT superfamily N-acetyltransferase
MQIHAATEADIPAIVAMSARFYETTSYAGFAVFDPQAAESLARNMIDSGVMLMAGDVGMVGLMVVPFMFNPDHRVAYEVVWWVNPEAQGLGAGKALLAAIEPACRAKGCTAIQMVHLANSPPQASALYERMGFAHTESSYTKELV